MRIVIPDFISLTPEGKENLKKIPNLTMYDDMINDPNILKERIKDAEVITVNFIDLTAEVIEKSPNLKYVISPAKGYDWIDIDAATKKGIKVINCPTYNSQAVAEHAIGLILAVKRKIVLAHQSILKGEFKQHAYIGTELEGKTLLTVGHGSIGKKILKMASALGMLTDYTDSKTAAEAVDKKISVADVIVLCLPLTKKTENLINDKRLSLMKKTATLINVARGLIVDQEALYTCLKEGKIAGAGIDTFAKDETITKVRDDIINFAKLPNVVATPHIAYNTEEAAERLGKELSINIEAILKGAPINVVNL